MKPVVMDTTTGYRQPHPVDADTVEPLPYEDVEGGGIASVWEPDADEYSRLGLDMRIGVRVVIHGDCAPIALELVGLAMTPNAAPDFVPHSIDDQADLDTA